MLREVIFVCTGNYYRSRFAETYFNHRKKETNLGWEASSRGLNIYNNNNVGPISTHSTDYLKALSIPVHEELRFPLPLLLDDLVRADLVILLDRKEHFPMLQEQFPQYLSSVQFWDFPDVHIAPSSEILPKIKIKVEELLLQLP